MRARTSVVLAALTASAFAAFFPLSACSTGDAASPAYLAPDASILGAPPGASARALGAACASSAECASAHCVDGVCCASACDGACEACDLAGARGACAPIPAGRDPARECASLAPPARDAGARDAGEDGASIALPDAGIAFDDAPCAAACNGARACAFPDSRTACGSSFCDDAVNEARAACDGRGTCALVIDACQAYACDTDGIGCNTSCVVDGDCLAAFRCDLPSATCVPRRADGAPCASPAECASGACVQGACCAGYWRDADGDGFGDAKSAPAGCASGAAPAGYVADATDCDDTNASVHPGQAAFFAAPRADGSFDYDCDGATEKETLESPGATCAFCERQGYLCAPPRATCAAAGDPATLACDATATRCGEVVCVTCGGGEGTGFTSTVACGASGTLTRCGACAAPGGAPQGTTTAPATQRCR